MRKVAVSNIQGFKAKPFVKWAGGKGQLLTQLDEHLPKELYNEKFTYIEPFVGGGAMLFYMLQKFPNIKRVVINDINHNLAEAYINIKDNAEGLIYRLKHIEQQYSSISDYEEQRKYYLEMRRKFNEDNLSSIDKTVILIFLNRTCFNGLYRENSKGKFNVPFGKYTNPTICNEDLIYADSELLNQYEVEITCGDFAETILKIDENRLNFFYFDPPYRPLSSTSSFNSYVKEAFGDDEQKRLANFCKKISRKKNCLWMLSNADCSSKNPEDIFFENLYSKYVIQRVYASRSVNAIASKRGKLSELLIMNYTKKTISIKENNEYELYSESI